MHSFGSNAPVHAEGVEIIQPRVARNELPWVPVQKQPYPERVAAKLRTRFNAHNRL
jgi:hypothetical protein